MRSENEIGRRCCGAAAAAALAVALLGGCGSIFGSKSSQPEPTSGTARGTLPSGASARLVFERTLAADALDAPSARLLATVTGATLTAATLRTPDARVIPLVIAAQGSSGASVAVEAADDGALLKQFPAGLYTFDLTLEGGARAMLGVAVRGAFAPFPEAVEPADGATEVPLLPTVTFSGIARSFDAAVVDVATGETTVLAEDSELGAASPGKALGAGRSYRLEVSAETGPIGGSYEFESTRTSTFTTAGAQ